MNFDTLCEELTRSAEIIRALLEGISPEEARLKPAADSWSILEVTCHLYDEEREDFREHLDFILHRQSEAWHPIDPVGWVAERKYNEQDFHEMQSKFFAERARSHEWLRGLQHANWDAVFTSRFGSLSAGDMISSWVAHDNLHIRQLVELRRLRIEMITSPYAIEYAGDW
jgi:hypothetical protein